MSKVVFIAPIYLQPPTLVASLIDQDHQNWELLLIHDGPISDEDPFDIRMISSGKRTKGRVRLIEEPEHQGLFGHPIRRKYLAGLNDITSSDFVVMTNADNYHTPNYCSALLSGFGTRGGNCPPYNDAGDFQGVGFTYCSHMVHNYWQHTVRTVELACGGVDCACVMARTYLAQQAGWTSDAHAADFVYIEAMMRWLTEHKRLATKVNGCLISHN